VVFDANDFVSRFFSFFTSFISTLALYYSNTRRRRGLSWFVVRMKEGRRMRWRRRAMSAAAAVIVQRSSIYYPPSRYALIYLLQPVTDACVDGRTDVIVR